MSPKKNQKVQSPTEKPFHWRARNCHILVFIGSADEGVGEGAWILVLEQYVEDGITTNHHAKLVLSSFKRLKVIQS